MIRLFWMVGGNFILFFLTIAIFKRGSLSELDLAYWLVVIAQISLRFYDIRYLGGATADYATATMQDWIRFSAILTIAALLIWAAVHLIS